MKVTSRVDDFVGFLGGVRVLEVGDELGEYCGKVLAGLGADVVRIEPPEGTATRSYGPFYHDEPHRDRSLHFWHYNLGKRSAVMDLDTPEGQADFHALAATADVIIDSRPRGYLSERNSGWETLATLNPRLIYARISPFGDTGPWADFEASDLIHLALGGVMMNCGYDPDPTGFYDTPPVAPQMWQSYHIAGEMTAMSILGALQYRLTSGHGQHLSTSIHEAVSKNTETDLPDWVLLKQAHLRLTCRHSVPTLSGASLSMTKDGRYLLPYRTYLKEALNAWDGTVALLKKYKSEGDLEGPRFYGDKKFERESTDYIAKLTDELVSRHLFERDLWREAQEFGLPWAPVRRPEENAHDEHWLMRGAFFDVYHPELDETFRYTGGKWLTEDMDWQRGPRPPLLGEHTEDILKEWSAVPVKHVRSFFSPRPTEVETLSPHGKPFALSGVRVIDLSWMLASAGAGRYLAAMGAEVIKVEHISRPDAMRFSLGACPPGGRAERDAATDPLPTPPIGTNPNRGGSFMEINSGKQSLSLNLKHPEGRTILEDLIRDADMIVEGFSPGTMTRMGLSYERLKELNPNIIYVQQSGFGETGTYGRARAYGPTAQAITGLSDMSGLPEPFPPAGIGYSYLDWFGAYNMAVAMLAALYRRDITGEGCHIDASQAETGIYLTGTAILDHTINGRRWSRYGNRSPHKPAAPHGAYRTRGNDRWIAIAAFTDQQWHDLIDVLELTDLADDIRFTALETRINHQDDLDKLIDTATQRHKPFDLMTKLQARGVPAGVCQTAEDRYETDPQLAHDHWLVELPQSEIGTWPVKEHPVRFSETPTHIGGRINRSGPSYGEDTDQILAQLLNLDQDTINNLHHNGAL
ncbi:CaiB/BaiF CoA transferase family protein [Rhodococcus sp. ACPA4]|uniref:CaiB/BaiF CoA transferase family protein n=1 Tax=Rhodococcus sp. ACPA4 TaxID=2028571 RepID=UPI001C531CA9|nr:CoA transferase [Rhodococcus sp. ACPA4]